MQRNIDAAQHVSRSKGVGVRARDQVRDGDAVVVIGPITRPHLPDTVESGGQRDHRSGRQGQRDVAADGGGLPDLERGQQCCCAAREQCGGRPRRGVARQSLDGAGGSDLEPGLGDGQRLPAQGGDIDEGGQVVLLLGEQPGTAGKDGGVRASGRKVRAGAGKQNVVDSAEIHGLRSPRSRRQIHHADRSDTRCVPSNCSE